MDSLTAIAASGMRSRMESLDLLANNVANASTGGYKADREFYSLYVAPEIADPSDAAAMPVVERPWTDLSQGTVQPTGNPLDLALTGKGFFTVQGPSGALYTRSGSFRAAPDGRLVTAEGYPVQGAGGARLTVQSSAPVDVAADGTISQNGAAIGQLEIVDFTDPSGLVKQGKTYFRPSDSGQQPVAAPSTTVAQRQLEASNTGTAESAVRLVSVMRQFEMLQKAASLGADMNKEAIEQVAKVG